jgi:hypothetical protein
MPGGGTGTPSAPMSLWPRPHAGLARLQHALEAARMTDMALMAYSQISTHLRALWFEVQMSETYPYEQLDSSRFQRLAQALLKLDYPGLQCLPLSGADGGRDAIQMAREGTKLVDSIIFQVKLKEASPLGKITTQALYRWLTDRLRQEIPNLELLKERGAAQYVVLTNIKGTGARDSGLRDKMRVWVQEHLPIRTSFWWRDDLDARLVGNYDLVFRFNLFTGPESVRAILEELFANQRTHSGLINRSETPPAINTLMAYVADQHRVESNLRFEQADIASSPLLDLFVDVPAAFQGAIQNRRQVFQWIRTTARSEAGDEAHLVEIDLDQPIPPAIESAWHRYASSDPRSPQVGAADLMLSNEIPKVGMRVVVEAAPGQGKSTLGQYLCQVHRIRFLDKYDDKAKLPERHMNAPLRLPIRVEFRHLASWFSGTNPWTSENISNNVQAERWSKSLESFIAAHVRHSTGGLTFTADDAVAILSRTPSFLFLDGLDEIADIELRQNIVDAVEASLTRLESVGADLQVFITSRPAIFVKAHGFSRKGFLYLQLASLNGRLIESYTQAWIRIRDIPDEHATEIVEILRSNLQQSHVAELARNPMQLAIFLWLISVKGRSLPDQRTALYEQYMNAFLDREAKKSAVVRTHRARLLELHGFLGWLLHCRAESRNSRYAGGDITAAELLAVFRDYLIREERPTDWVDQLFAGAERVFVLVSRIEGKYEFEVQPIREFFAARYLYKTAPHSTSAAPASGSRPERLKQLLRNPYWLNVTRFFCGWYDKGELADLSRHLRDLCADPEYKLLGHPRYLIASILQDYTTAESQRDTRELVSAMSDALGLRLLTSQNPRAGFGQGIGGKLLPADCGLAFLVERLSDALVETKKYEIATDLAASIKANDSPTGRMQRWQESEKNSKLTRAEWLWRGTRSDAISQMPLTDVLRIFDPTTCSHDDWLRCVEAGRFDVGFHDPVRFERFMDALGYGLGPLSVTTVCSAAGRLWRLPDVLSRERFHSARMALRLQPIRLAEPPPAAPLSMRHLIEPVDELVVRAAALETSPGARDIRVAFSALIDDVRSVFGESWVAWRLGLIGGTIPGWSVTKSISLHDSTVNPLLRARKARLSGDDLGYWVEAASIFPRTRELRLAICVALLSWASPRALTKALPVVAAWWHELDASDVQTVMRNARVLSYMSGVGRSGPRQITKKAILAMPELPLSMSYALLIRADREANTLIGERVEKLATENPQCLAGEHGGIGATLVLASAIDRWNGQRNWRARMDWIETVYSAVMSEGFATPESSGWGSYPASSEIAIARKILSAPDDYPTSLLRLADAAASSDVATRLRPLQEVAIDGRWFPGLPI